MPFAPQIVELVTLVTIFILACTLMAFSSLPPSTKLKLPTFNEKSLVTIAPSNIKAKVSRYQHGNQVHSLVAFDQRSVHLRVKKNS